MLIIFILLGLCLGSFFYAIISVEVKSSIKKCGKSRFHGKHVMSVLVMGAMGAMIYFCINNLEPYHALIAVITLLVLGFECVSDMVCMHTYTIPIYIAGVIIIFIKTIYEIEYNGIPLILMYGAIVLFGTCCYCISVLTSRQIGAGDLDICFLIFLTQSGFAAILLISTIVIFLRCSLSKPDRYHTIVQEQTVLSKKIPFVPFLLLGYIAAIIFSGVM